MGVGLILQPVPPERLHDSWGWIRDGLWRVKDKCNEPWFPEDVIYQLGAKAAFLYECPGGFFVFQRHVDLDGPALFVWIMCGELMPFREQIKADLQEIARAIGAKRVRFHSPRKGYAKMGFGKMKTTIYELEL